MGAKVKYLLVVMYASMADWSAVNCDIAVRRVRIWKYAGCGMDERSDHLKQLMA